MSASTDRTHLSALTLLRRGRERRSPQLRLNPLVIVVSAMLAGMGEPDVGIIDNDGAATLLDRIVERCRS
ncbi:hypothetical protein EEB14_35070 [Rhodococcus sp. WS4]|nr:hypothetical protein EEB14_35070 [Rhodococcus sp. WS4]